MELVKRLERDRVELTGPIERHEHEALARLVDYRGPEDRPNLRRCLLWEPLQIAKVVEVLFRTV